MRRTKHERLALGRKIYAAQLRGVPLHQLARRHDISPETAKRLRLLAFEEQQDLLTAKDIETLRAEFVAEMDAFRLDCFEQEQAFPPGSTAMNKTMYAKLRLEATIAKAKALGLFTDKLALTDSKGTSWIDWARETQIAMDAEQEEIRERERLALTDGSRP